MIVLRDYQVAALDACRREYARGKRWPLLVLPTGAGKTATAVDACVRAAKKGERVLWTAPRRELVTQAAETIRRAGIDPGVILADHERGDTASPIQVAGLQTLLAKPRDTWPDASFVVSDEAHHVVSDEWSQIAKGYPTARGIGLTATPERGDGRSLGDAFDALVVGATIAELTARGFLVPCDVVAPARKLRGLATDPAAAVLKHAEGRPTVVFCTNVKHARDVADELHREGITAACVDGQMPNDRREEALARFAAGGLQVLTNVSVLTEGWDAPIAAVAVLARGCSSASLYLQIVGRILRPAPGKTRALLVDLTGCVHTHGLPDEEREYSLEGTAIRRGKRTPITQCLACGAVFRPRRTCPACGRVAPAPRAPRIESAPVSRVVSVADREARAYRALLDVAMRRGFKPGWAKRVFAAKYGHLPAELAP